MRATTLSSVSLLLALTLAVHGSGTEAGDMKPTHGDDRQRILDHIHGIFRAYIDKDRETIRATHTEDWTGFLGPSTRIERGIGDYMRHAETSLQSFDGTGYELLDTEIQFHGDVAIVFYVARYDLRDKDGAARSLMLRSIDLYRRQEGEWIQFGSHITPFPEGGTWGVRGQRPPQ